jgi:hypothetical protein
MAILQPILEFLSNKQRRDLSSRVGEVSPLLVLNTSIERLRTIPIHERYAETEIRDIAATVRKVTETNVLRQ